MSLVGQARHGRARDTRHVRDNVLFMRCVLTCVASMFCMYLRCVRFTCDALLFVACVPVNRIDAAGTVAIAAALNSTMSIVGLEGECRADPNSNDGGRIWFMCVHGAGLWACDCWLPQTTTLVTRVRRRSRKH